MGDEFLHRPVLLEEALSGLNIRPDGRYVDGTFGRGGHAQAILQRLSPKGALLVMDRDPQAISAAQQMFADDQRVCIAQGSFATLGRVISMHNWHDRVDGVLLDLGVSSPQLDDPDRGFSFMRDGVLDMRMDPDAGISVAQWLKDVSQLQLAQVLRDYGDERYAKRISKAIVKYRESAPITSTAQLAKIIATAHPKWERGKNPATRCFLALRIFINDELGELQSGLSEILNYLDKGGRLVVISFHSLEDRIVKRYFRSQSRGDHYPRDLPVTHEQMNPQLKTRGKPIRPSQDEIDRNLRSRSAVLRVAEKL